MRRSPVTVTRRIRGQERSPNRDAANLPLEGRSKVDGPTGASTFGRGAATSEVGASVQGLPPPQNRLAVLTLPQGEGWPGPRFAQLSPATMYACLGACGGTSGPHDRTRGLWGA